jgi:protein required for attachment to host cells
VKNQTTWVVVADGASARVFSLHGHDSFELVKSLSSSDAAAPVSDLVTDHPGRSRGTGGGGRHALEPHTDPKVVAKDIFLRELVDFIHSAEHRAAFDRLILVAPARALGRLRKLLPEHILAKLAAEVRKDLTKDSPHELKERLASQVPL